MEQAEYGQSTPAPLYPGPQLVTVSPCPLYGYPGYPGGGAAAGLYAWVARLAATASPKAPKLAVGLAAVW